MRKGTRATMEVPHLVALLVQANYGWRLMGQFQVGHSLKHTS